MAPTIVPRTSIGLKQKVTTFNRVTARPLLRQNLNLTVAHYTGTKRKFVGANYAKDIRAIDRWKAGEYNYVIPKTAEPLVVELAGPYQAAHAKGFNDRSVGILFLNGIDDPVTDAQVEAYRWLIGMLKWVGQLEPGAWQVQHGQIAATECPGPVKARWAELTAP